YRHERRRAAGQDCGAVALVLLAGRLVDLKDRDTGELWHSPGAAIQPGAENYQLRAGVGAYRVVNGDGAGHDQLGAGPHGLVVDPLPPLSGYDTVAYPLDRLALVGTQQQYGRRIGEAAGSDEAVRGGATLADQYRGAAGTKRLRHRFLRGLGRQLCA